MGQLRVVPRNPEPRFVQVAGKQQVSDPTSCKMSSSGVTVKVNGYSVVVESRFCEVTLKTVLTLLGDLPC